MSGEGRLPTFLVIGAPRAGTTAVYRYLAEHPEVGMPGLKELRYFGNDDGKMSRPASDLDTYRRHFRPAAGERAWGEASPQYLRWSADAATHIHATIPDVRLLAVLRDPADRAYSQFTYFHRSSVAVRDRVTRGFGEELAATDGSSGALETFPGLRESCYADDLETYFERFGAQLEVFLYDDLQIDPVATMQAMYDHIGVDAMFEPQVARKHNENRVPKSRRLDALLFGQRRLDRLVGASVSRRVLDLTTKPGYEPLAPDDRARLIALFRTDIERTASLIGRDLTPWLTIER